MKTSSFEIVSKSRVFIAPDHGGARRFKGLYGNYVWMNSTVWITNTKHNKIKNMLNNVETSILTSLSKFP